MMNKKINAMKKLQILLLFVITLFPSVLISQNTKSKKDVRKEMQEERGY